MGWVASPEEMKPEGLPPSAGFKAAVAQLVEQLPCKQQVRGSMPLSGYFRRIK